MARVSALLAVGFLLAGRAYALEPLPSTPIVLDPFVITGTDLVNFDIEQARDEMRAELATQHDVAPHSLFIVKHHIGIATGYDDHVMHTSLGYYVTVAEWGRWNYGAPGVELGFGRYPEYSYYSRQVVEQDEVAIFISMASIHYRVKYIRSLGANLYLNLEQIYDLRHNYAGSQFGVSFSQR